MAKLKRHADFNINERADTEQDNTLSDVRRVNDVIDDLSKAVEQYRDATVYKPGIHNSQEILDAIQAVDNAVEQFKSGMNHDMEDLKVMSAIGKIDEITNLKSTPRLGKEPKTLVYPIVDARPDWTEIVKKHLKDRYMGYKVIYATKDEWRDLIK